MRLALFLLLFSFSHTPAVPPPVLDITQPRYSCSVNLTYWEMQDCVKRLVRFA